MARTDEGGTLTEQHRQAQLQIRAQALRDFATIWPLWQAAEPASFPTLVTAAMPLIRAYHRLSSSIAAAYFDAFRAAENVAGGTASRLAPAVVDRQVATSLYVTGKVAAERARNAGASDAAARERALVSASGAVTRHVLAGGRDTIIASVAGDPEARGWARVTDGDPCAFCAMLAGRGPIYKTDESARFEAHDHCGCAAEPVYQDSAWPGRSRDFADLYTQATRDAAASGDLDRGTSNDLLNAFRRAYDAQRAGQAGA